MGMYLGPLCYDYALNCHLVYLAIPGSRLLCIVCFIYVQTQKLKFKSVQINMEPVSYKFSDHDKNTYKV